MVTHEIHRGVTRTQARAAGAVLAGALSGFFVVNTYWSLGGEWGVREALGGNAVPPRVLLWVQGLLVLAAIGLVLARSGLWRRPAVAGWILSVGVWAQAGVYALVAVINVLGSTRWERFVFAPTGLLLAALAVMVALAPQPRGGRSSSPLEFARTVRARRPRLPDLVGHRGTSSDREVRHGRPSSSKT